MGTIAVETRTIERIVPADPANAASMEQKVMEAGQVSFFYCFRLLTSQGLTILTLQVWYPNSAFKTAQAIFDFDREGLPLIIFANWRGFSGGQQDMFDEVLKRYAKPTFFSAPLTHVLNTSQMQGFIDR